MARISASERAATRQRLIDAGKAEFAERGLAGARFDEISLAAGCAKGTIYNYFADKETLFFSIVEEWCRHLVAGFVDDVQRPTAETLREIVRLDIEVARKDAALARVVINQLPALADRHRADVAAAIAPGIELLRDVLHRGQAAGEVVDSYSPQTLARIVLNGLSAIEQEALDVGSDISLDDVVELADRLVVRGVLVREDAS